MVWSNMYGRVYHDPRMWSTFYTRRHSRHYLSGKGFCMIFSARYIKFGPAWVRFCTFESNKVCISIIFESHILLVRERLQRFLHDDLRSSNKRWTRLTGTGSLYRLRSFQHNLISKRSTSSFQRIKSKYKGIKRIFFENKIIMRSRLVDYLYKESKSVSGEVKTKIPLHSHNNT